MIDLRRGEYDFIKGLAIIFVILLHSISFNTLYKIFAPWHIWQAIPLFVIVSGALYANSRKTSSKVSVLGIKKSIAKLIEPALILWLIQLGAIYLIKGGGALDVVYELVKQGGFGAGGYFVYIAVQNIILSGVYYFIVKKWGRIGLGVLALYSVSVDILAIGLPMDEELYRVLATRYAFFFALGVAHTEKILDVNLLIIAFLWMVGLIWLVVIQVFFFDLDPVYPFWHSHTALSGFVAYGYFLALIFMFKKISSHGLAQIICTLGKFSYYIFLIQMMYFWIRRWMESHDLYPSTNMMVLVDLLVCIFVGMLYAKAYESWVSIRRLNVVR